MVMQCESYDLVHKWLVQRSEDFGRKAVAVSLPPDWTGRDVIYQAHHEEHSWWVTNKFSDESVELTMVNDPDQQLSMIIDMNWSERRATIRDSTGAYLSENCWSFCRKLAVQKPERKQFLVSPCKKTESASGSGATPWRKAASVPETRDPKEVKELTLGDELNELKDNNDKSLQKKPNAKPEEAGEGMPQTKQNRGGKDEVEEGKTEKSREGLDEVEAVFEPQPVP